MARAANAPWGSPDPILRCPKTGKSLGKKSEVLAAKEKEESTPKAKAK
ncbi:MAG: hypothetical protein AAGA67_13020 [Cyanobacteria bacterium P01_F01_bin.153]